MFARREEAERAMRETRTKRKTTNSVGPIDAKLVNGHFDPHFDAFVRGMHAFVSRCKISFEFDRG
jgi:hypothetical protein